MAQAVKYTVPTYEDAGFNGFFSRSITANPVATTLQASAQQPPMLQPTSTAVSYDSTQSSGAMGDSFMVGQFVKIDGTSGRISVLDDEGNEVTRIGSLDNQS